MPLFGLISRELGLVRNEREETWEVLGSHQFRKLGVNVLVAARTTIQHAYLDSSGASAVVVSAGKFATETPSQTSLFEPGENSIELRLDQIRLGRCLLNVLCK